MTSLRHLRSSTANKRPDPTAMVDGQLAMNYDIASPGLFFKDDNGTLVKVGPVHVGPTAPNVSPAAGGTAGNSIGEQWLDTTGGVYVLKVWDGSAWRSESGTFVDVSGDTMTGALTMANQQAVRFSETTANGSNYIALQATAAIASNKTITLPDTTGTIVTTGDTGTVTSTMIENGTILNADVNASAAIAGTKVSPDFGSQTIVTTGVHSAAAGSAAAPSIAFTGDLNTGIYSPSADQLAVSTGGTGRLFVDSSGNVGIGTSSPAGTLHVNGGDIILQTGDPGNRLIRTLIAGGAIQLRGSSATPDRGLRFGIVNNDAVFSEMARIDDSGRLLVGTSTAYQQFKTSGFDGSRIIVSGDSDNTSNINIHRNANDQFNAKLIISKARGSTYQSVLSGDILGSINFAGADNSGTVEAAAITAYVDGTPGADDMPGRLVFSTTADGASSPTERMRIDSSGKLLVGTSSAISGNYVFQVVGKSGVNWPQMLMRHPDASSGKFWQIGPDNGNSNYVIYNQSSEGLYIADGQNSWSSSSDERLKTDLVNIEDGLAKVGALRAVTGRFKTDPEGTSKSFLIAQDVLSVFPEPVDTQNPDKLGLAYTGMIPLLVAALKESKERIETLEAAVAALQSA